MRESPKPRRLWQRDHSLQAPQLQRGEPTPAWMGLTLTHPLWMTKAITRSHKEGHLELEKSKNIRFLP